jgi:hypothetical protein
MNINLSKLNFEFQDKPLLFGGKAMEYYELRKAGADIDFIISARDHEELKKQYPNNIKDVFGDIGICEFEFEIWNQVCMFDYEYLKQNAIEKEEYLVIALDKHLVLKALAMNVEKYKKDFNLLVNYIRDVQYKIKELP